jgi:hypothetical protein
LLPFPAGQPLQDPEWGPEGRDITPFSRDNRRALQGQRTERNQGANLELNGMVELMQQAGSSLPDSGWTMIRREDGGLLVAVNARSAERFNGAATPSSLFAAP